MIVKVIFTKVNLIVATSLNGVIAFQGKIPWDCPEDREFFWNAIRGSTVIVGRKTFREIEERLFSTAEHVIVLSRGVGTMDYTQLEYDGGQLAESFDEAMQLACDKGGQVFVIGGEKVYQDALNAGVVDRIFKTTISRECHGDRFFFMPSYGFKKIHHEGRVLRKQLANLEVYERFTDR